MNLTNHQKSDLSDLVISFVKKGTFELPADREAEERLKKYLEDICVRDELRAAHTRFLAQALGGREAPRAPGSSILKAIEEGANALNPEELATLLLDPEALLLVASGVEARVPEAYCAAIEREAHRLLKEHGVSPPSLRPEKREQRETMRTRGMRTLDISARGEGQQAKPSAKAPEGRLSWRFRIPAESIESAPASLAGQRAELVATWSGSELEIAASGFLELAEGSSLEVVWEAQDGNIIESGRTESPARFALRAQRAPQGQDRLRVTYRRSARGESFELRFVCSFESA